MATYTLVMQAVVELNDGDRVFFTPGPASLCSDDRGWADFCKARHGEECILLSADMPPESSGSEDVYERVAQMMDRLAGPSFKVQFVSDGFVKERIGAHHFTLPALQTV